MPLEPAKHDPGPVMKKPRMELHSQTNLKAIPRHHDMLRERRPIERERTSVIRDRRHVVHEKRLAPSQKYVRPVQVMRKTLPRSSETVSKEVKEKEGKGAQENPVKEKASADTEKTKDSNPDEHFELNPLMSRMLEAELQDIMIKIRKELPDGVTEAEKLVINKLKNEAGDDLRDVLGLNVTKRLLNVYNPLYVKAEFTRKTDPTSLKELLHKFNCEKLLSNNIIKMKNISDFDAICKAKNIRCGKAKVYIVPRYKFTQCPSKLKTIYNDVEAKKRRQNESEKNNCAENTENDKLSSESIVNKSHNANTNGAKNNDIKSKEVHNTAPENQTETPKDNKSVPTPIKTTAPQKNNTNASTATETVVSTPTKTVQAGTKTIPATKGGVASSANAVTPLTKVVVTKAESSSPKAKAATAVYTQRDKVQAMTATKSVTTPNKAISKVAAKSVDTPGKAVAAAAANSVPAPAKAVAPAAAKSVATTSKAIAAAAAKSVPAPAKAVATAAAKSVATPSKAISDVAAKSVATPSKAVTTVTAKSISTPSKVVATVAAKSVASAAKAVATPTKAVAKPTKAVATPTKAVATPNKAVATITKDLNENRKGIANVTIKTKPAEGDLTSKKVTDPKKASKIIMTKNKKINQILASDNKNDDDELNDEDILALISEGIVLDECSGSDGE